MLRVRRLAAALLMLGAGVCTAQNRIIPHEIKSVINLKHEGTMDKGNVNDLCVAYPYVYCAGTPGLATIDVSDPASPALKSEQDSGSVKSFEPCISMNHLYLANWHEPLRVFSLADPEIPVSTFHYNRNEDHTYGWQCTAYGNRLYASEGASSAFNRVWMYDLSTPSRPAEIVYHEPAHRKTGGLLRIGNILYFTNNRSLHYADVSNDTFVMRGSKHLDALACKIATDGSHLYVLAKKALDYDDGGGLHVFSIANPVAPVEVAFWDKNDSPRDVYVHSGMAFVATGGNELFTLDITNPANPTKIAHTKIEDFPICVDGYGKYLYVGSAQDTRRPEEFWGAKLTVVQILEDTPTPTSTPTATPTPTPTVMKGDLDADGDLDLFDTLRMVDILLTRPPDPSPYELLAGDMDDDGDVDLFDVLELVEILIHGP